MDGAAIVRWAIIRLVRAVGAAGHKQHPFARNVTDRSLGANKSRDSEVTAEEDDLKDWMIRSLDGDAAAYHSLLRGVAPLLRAFFGRRLHADSETEDLVQEALMALHSRLLTFDRSRPFTPWLYAIARYKLADHFRRSRQFVDIDSLEAEPSSGNFESASVASILLAELLDGLTPKQRGAIRATKIEGYSIAEAANAAGISQSDAKMSVSRGLKRMTARLQGKAQ